jgi:endonuclease/exonuclease/phosphatase family metal-dependent hydrolase
VFADQNLPGLGFLNVTPHIKMIILSQNVCTPVLGALPNKHLRIEKFLEHVGDDVDVIALQEVFGWCMFWTKWVSWDLHLKKRLAEMGFKHTVESPNQLWGQTGGLLTASREPMTEVKHLTFKAWSGMEAWTWKGAISAKIGGLTVVNTHLQSGGASARLLQLEELNDFASCCPQIIVGDFNLDGFVDGETTDLAEKMAGMSDVVPESETLDVCESFKNELLDHALVYGIKNVSCQLLDLKCSDHPALLCDVS